MHESVRATWIWVNEPYEGRVRHMYLDSNGWVTTGVGNKIDQTPGEMSPPTPSQREVSLILANRIPWTRQSDDSPANPSEVAIDWDAVKSRLDLASNGHRAFEPLTAVRLQDAAIDVFVMTKLAENEAELRRRPEFGEFEGWPADAQLAVHSMAWAMGTGRFDQFPNFRAAVAQRDWRRAVEECRMQPDKGTLRLRNILDKKSLTNAARVDEEEINPTLLIVDLSGIFGVQRALRIIGYDPGPQDGETGPKTRAALSEFQSAYGLAVTGEPSGETVEALAGVLDPSIYVGVTPS